MSSQTVKLQGSVFRHPELKTSKKGKDYTVVTLRVRGGEKLVYWRVMGFDSLNASLMLLKDKQTVEIIGPMSVDTYDKDGEARVSLTCFAKQVRDWTPDPKDEHK